MFQKIKEGQAEVFVPKEEKISKELPVFYNPVMRLNRDISVLLLNSTAVSDMQIALPLAGTGVRGVRFCLELKEGKVKSLHVNDMSSDAVSIIKKNLKHNYADAKVYNQDANEFLLQSKGFDYIDIDPFGTPNPFLDSAIKRLSRCGILAVTATDTSALCGSFPKACLRKYWAKPSRTELMHEAGLRILIRKVQLIASQYDRALTPIFSYSKDHYMRVFFKSKKGKQKVDDILKQHGLAEHAGEAFGPLWLGRLWDKVVADEIVKQNTYEKNHKFLQMIADESKIDTVFFYDIHPIIKRHKIKSNPRKHELIGKIKELGYNASETHFSPTAIRCDMPFSDFLALLKKDKQ